MSSPLVFKDPPKDLTFETFVPCADNMFALQAAILMAENGSVSTEESLLYVYGDSGVGKTHLLGAVANERSRLSTLFVDVIELRTMCEDAWDRGIEVELKDRLVEPDILVLDNIQASSDHEQFQTELFGIIELRFDAGLGVLAGSDVPPSALKTFDPKHDLLLGRGKIVRLEWADENGRAQILRSRLNRAFVPDYIVRSLSSRDALQNGHELQAVIKALTAYPEVVNLLCGQGYTLHIVRTSGSKNHIFSRWVLVLGGRTHVVDVAYSLQTGTISTRCWSHIGS